MRVQLQQRDVLFDASELEGRTILMNPQENGQRLKAKIVQPLMNQETDPTKDPSGIEFHCPINDSQYEEVLSYKEILSHIKQEGMEY